LQSGHVHLFLFAELAARAPETIRDSSIPARGRRLLIGDGGEGALRGLSESASSEETVGELEELFLGADTNTGPG
jgi:hypothetical protein